MLARLISAKQVVLMSTGCSLFLFYNGKVYHREGIYAFHLPTHQRDRHWPIFTLIDVDVAYQGPFISSDYKIWPIQASPPEPDKWRSWSKQRGAALLGMPLWSFEELMEGYVWLFSAISLDLLFG